MSNPAKESRLQKERNTLNLRCYAYGSGRSWEAICVDFDIAVFGRSPGDARSSLETGIELYLEEVAAATPQDRRYLLNRRSPWRLRTKLRFRAWTNGVRGGLGRLW